jgi:hypothetical protein
MKRVKFFEYTEMIEEIVAIKKLYVSTKHNPQNSNHVMREIKCMSKITHENVSISNVAIT